MPLDWSSCMVLFEMIFPYYCDGKKATCLCPCYAHVASQSEDPWCFLIFGCPNPIIAFFYLWYACCQSYADHAFLLSISTARTERVLCQSRRLSRLGFPPSKRSGLQSNQGSKNELMHSKSQITPPSLYLRNYRSAAPWRSATWAFDSDRLKLGVEAWNTVLGNCHILYQEVNEKSRERLHRCVLHLCRLLIV